MAVLVAALAAGFLAAGCGSGVSSAIKSLAPSVSLSLPSVPAGPTPASTPAQQPSAAAPTPTPQPSVTTQPAAQPSSTPAASGSGSSLTWLWILVGAVVVIGAIVIVLIARQVGGRRSVVVGGWLSRAVDAYAQGSALHDAMSIAARPDALGAAESGARWADIQRRADEFTQTLYALREAAVEDDDRVRVADVVGTLQAARSAMDAQRALGSADAAQAEIVRARLAAFEQALRELRPSDRRAR